MQDIQQREEKIKARRKTTPFRDFVKEIGSWRTFMFYKTEKGVSIYPNKQRKLALEGANDYLQNNPEGISEYSEYVPDKGFFEQFQKFFYSVPQATISKYGLHLENCDWCDAPRDGAKNVYLSVSVGGDAENVLYSFKAEVKVKNVYNSFNVTVGSDIVYQSKTVRNSYKVFYSQYIYDSSDIRFSSNLMGCTHCFGCDELQNKSYCIENKQYTKEEYMTELNNRLAEKNTYDLLRVKYRKGGGIKISENCLGDGIFHCKDIEAGYEIAHMNTCRNILFSDGGNGSSNCYDCMDVASDDTHYLYGVYGQAFGSNIYCSIFIGRSSNIYYSYYLQNCSYCIGCIGLKNKSFCIFNKQYTKEDRFKKANQIFAQMEKDGTLGAFFPGWMNPFYFNDTVAYLIDDSFTKEEVEKEGYLRRDEEIKVDIPANADVITTQDLAQYQGYDKQGQWRLDQEILKKVIKDEKGNYYKIVPMELEFLQKHGLPLPEIHWLERIRLGFKFS